MNKTDSARLIAQLNERTAIIDGALDGIVVIDDTGIVCDFNRAAESMFGYSREEAIGSQIVELIIPDHHRDQHEAGFRSYIKGGSEPKMIGRRIETEARRKCGELFPVELTIIETQGSDRPVFAGYLRDLTDRREIETKLARQRDMIHQNEKLGSMGSLLANVAHELNNPLSVVIGQAELLRESPLDPAVRQRTDRILSAANRCASIVHAFLAAARQKPPVRRAFDPGLPVTASVDLVEHSYSSDGVELTVDIGDSLPVLFGDDGQIGQVLANLLTNAQQALGGQQPPKRVTLTVTFDNKTGCVVYSVADNGPGVSDELRSRIFEPFFTTKEEGAGTGVGLAIAHNIVAAHHGTLEIGTCARLGGAVFELRLPVGQQEHLDEQTALEAGGHQEPSQLSVLVVDDDMDVAETVADLLSFSGMQVEITSSAEKALEMMGSNSYDVILSDLRMPNTDGPAYYNEAKQRWPGIERRFGVITGDSLNASAAKFLRTAEVPVAEKPVTRDKLLSLIDSVRAQYSK